MKIIHDKIFSSVGYPMKTIKQQIILKAEYLLFCLLTLCIILHIVSHNMYFKQAQTHTDYGI